MQTTKPTHISFRSAGNEQLRRAPNDRFALFIDGANFYSTMQMLGVEVDFERLLAYFSRPHRPVRAYYYTAIPRADVPHNMHNLVRYLDYNGYQTVTKTMRTFTDEYTGEQRHKGNMDIELAVDCLELKDYLDTFILFSGDGDFIPLVHALQRHGKTVGIVSSERTKPPILSSELHRCADFFVELDTITADIIREERPIPPGAHSQAESEPA